MRRSPFRAPATDPDTIPADALPQDAPPPLSASADSVLQSLRSLPGYIVTEYQGRSAQYRTDTGTLRLEGDARVTRIGDELTADTIEFRQAEDLVRALGGARVVSSTQELESQILYYDVVRRRATADRDRAGRDLVRHR
jgi:lipopolysaccharide export system protein LptA